MEAVIRHQNDRGVVPGFLQQGAQHLVVELVSHRDHVVIKLEVALRDPRLARRMVAHERVAEVIDGFEVDREEIPRLVVQQPERRRTECSCIPRAFAGTRPGAGPGPDRSPSRAGMNGSTICGVRRSGCMRSRPASRPIPADEPYSPGWASLRSSGRWARWYWSETITPSIGSAGWLGHQPMTMLRRSFWLRMFHSAFDVRERLVTGRTPLPSGAGSVKPWMPCLNGRFPVAMEVHSIGERGGCSVAICPVAPFQTRRSTLGILPASMSGWMTFQSAASHPTSRTLRDAMKNGFGPVTARSGKRRYTKQTQYMSEVT